MTYLTALGCVLAIIAIVAVAGVIIAFLAKNIINVFEGGKRDDLKDEQEEVNSIKENVYNNKEVSYMTPEVSTTKSVSVEEDDDFSYALDVDVNRAKKEQEELKKEIEADDDFFADFKKEEPKESFDYKEEPVDEEDDFDIMSMVDEISDNVIETKRTEKMEEEKKKSEETASLLDKYSIDSILHDEEEEDEDEEDDEPLTVKPESDDVKEMKTIRDEIYSMLQELRGNKTEEAITEEEEAEIEEQLDERIDENLKVIEDLKKALEQKEEEINAIKDNQKQIEDKYAEINKNIVDEFNAKSREREEIIATETNEKINSLKAKLDAVSKQLEEERSENWKVAHSPASIKEVAERPVKVVESNIVDEDEEDDDEDENFKFSEIKRIADEELEQKVQERLESSTKVIEELTKKVEELTTVKTETVETIHFQFSTEAQYLNRIELLEERLREAKKDLKINDKEYKPIAKVKKTLERDKAKLRRREAIVANKKVALYGVNNYVDLDKEKAEKLAHDLELLDGLKYSVIHCEEVMNANKERFPVLEHTHNILSKNIADIEADLEELHKELKALRDKNGNY